MREKTSELHFSQDSIACVFRNGTDILQTFRRLVNGSLCPDDIEPIQAKMHNGKLTVFEGNRRLFLYKKLESAGLIDDVQVNNFNRYKEYTAIPGIPIRVRRRPHIDRDMDDIIRAEIGTKPIASKAVGPVDTQPANTMNLFSNGSNSPVQTRASTRPLSAYNSFVSARCSAVTPDRSERKQTSQISANDMRSTSISCVQLRPSEIYFAKDSVLSYYYDKRSLLTALREIHTQLSKPETLPKMKVCKCNGIWTVIRNNRLLLLYRLLESNRYLEYITVRYGHNTPANAIPRYNYPSVTGSPDFYEEAKLFFRDLNTPNTLNKAAVSYTYSQQDQRSVKFSHKEQNAKDQATTRPESEQLIASVPKQHTLIIHPELYQCVPTALHFSKTSVPHTFEDGHTLQETVNALCSKQLASTSLPPILVDSNHRPWTVVDGNRRLILYKLLHRNKIIDHIQVKLCEGNYSLRSHEKQPRLLKQ